MLAGLARTVMPVLGRLQVTTAPGAALRDGGIITANHSSLIDPGVVLAALRRMEVRPVVLATAGLWRIPLLGQALSREGHIPVHRGTEHAADALDEALRALAEGRHVLIYGEGRLPRHRHSGDTAPGPFRSGVARLAHASGAPVIPLGQAGARRITSGSRTKQLAGLVTSPLRRPSVHVHIGDPLRLTGTVPDDTAATRNAVAAAWRTAAGRLGAPAA
ncbi:lysophospholipid acyltransferase family protein [Streptomyces sp. NPDC057638]|uniref:lysophospholipid acyltransferase family protein n=1 Tax=Streptomyces sp. NPDC057638 TaxID=3346190 RepID=UPI0036744E0A